MAIRYKKKHNHNSLSMKKLNSATVALIACCLLLIVTLCYHSRVKRTVAIKVESLISQSTMLEMQRIIQAQKKTIDMYGHLPQVVYRCLDDEPKIKYPKHASDDYTTVLMGTNDECGDPAGLDAIILVHTAVYNFDKRRLFRQVYGDRNETWPYKFKLVFLIGKVLNAEMQINVELENRQYGDTVQGNFIDTYNNLTLKATMGFRWVSENCAPGYKLLLKMDDDVILDIHSFFRDYYDPLVDNIKKRRIFCQVWRNAEVNRSGKWKVEKGLFANFRYDFPYCSGFLVAITPDIVQSMYEKAKELDFFWIDDVFMYGMIPRALKGIGFTNIGHSKGGLLTQFYKSYNKCFDKQKEKCPFIGIVTSNEKEFFQAYNNFAHQRLKLNVTRVSDETSNIISTPTPIPTPTPISEKIGLGNIKGNNTKHVQMTESQIKTHT